MARNLDLKSVGPNTLAIHAGERPDPATGASSPNIVMSSTYVTDGPEAFSASELTPDSPLVYTRWANPTVRSLEEKVAALEGAEDAAAFASGMAAAAAICLSRLSSGDHMILSEVCYAGIAELARDTLPRMGIAVSFLDTSDLTAVANAMRDETRLVFIDTPCNPLMRLTDIAGVAAITKGTEALLAVDNTFASPIGCNPLALGADLVMHSATKYIGGHGDAMGGVVCGAADLIRPMMAEATVHYGGVMSPFNAWLIARGAATLPLRMKAHQATALAVARALEAHPKIERVLYPGLPSHPQHNLAGQQMNNFSAMLNFRVKGGAAEGQAVAECMGQGLDIIHYAVSLGHHRSLVVWMPTEGLLESSFPLKRAAAEEYRAWAGEGIFRLSVGLEDADDLVRDLEGVLG
ncbi:MAG: PLP-dependent aspartate aminotransferase family protein [Pseudomonadota bacterium]